MPVTHGVTGSSPVRTAIKITQYQSFGSVAQLNRASDYGSEGYRFESCRSHKGSRKAICEILFCPCSLRVLFFHCIEVGDCVVKLRGEC